MTKDPLFNKNTESVLRQIAEIVEWFDQNANSLDLHELVLKRNKLSSLTMYLTEATVRTGLVAQLAYIDRKVRIAYLERDYKLSKETDKKITDAMASNMALVDCEQLMKEEKTKEAIADRLQFILRQANKTLTAFHQTISILQKEKEESKYYEAIDSRIKEIRQEYDKQIAHFEERVDAAAKKFVELEKKIKITNSLT